MSSSGSSSSQRLERFCRLVGLTLEPFQRQIVREVFSGRRELLILLPRGNGKSTLMAALALWHLLTTPRAAVYVAAASRDQAAVLFDFARAMATAHPDIERRVTITRREIRTRDGMMRVISSDAPKQHGLAPTMVFVDELHAHRDDELYLALRTAMLKRPGAQLVTISTAGVGAESPLARLRARALRLPSLSRSGTLTRAVGDHFAMLEWALPEDWPLERAVEANPASWVTADGLEEQREAVHESAFRRYHCDQWVQAEQFWLPAGAWQGCAADYTIEDGEAVWAGVDVGGSRAASAVVWVTEDLRIGCQVFQGTEAVLAVQQKVRDLAVQFDVREVRFDPWRFQAPALELQAEGMNVVEFPQSHSRMVPASERLYAAVVEKRLKHPNDPVLNAHVAAAIAKDTPRGWRLDKSDRSALIDAVVALAMAVEAVEQKPEPTRFLGWLTKDGFEPYEPRGRLMALPRPCLKCGRPVVGRSYHPSCQPRPYEPGRLRGRQLQELNARVLAAFGHRCGQCGATGVPIEVHHRDHNHLNNDFRNLVPLCKPCHARAGRMGGAPRRG